ncbi:MAG: hypothetical protein JRJ29_09180 [Deltaproteobacteria bacterium]|nr:hypothetical protein [Deltaproteobacteria bacterium]
MPEEKRLIAFPMCPVSRTVGLVSMHENVRSFFELMRGAVLGVVLCEGYLNVLGLMSLVPFSRPVDYVRIGGHVRIFGRSFLLHPSVTSGSKTFSVVSKRRFFLIGH